MMLYSTMFHRKKGISILIAGNVIIKNLNHFHFKSFFLAYLISTAIKLNNGNDITL